MDITQSSSEETIVQQTLLDLHAMYPFERYHVTNEFEIGVLEDCTGLSVNEVKRAIDSLINKGIIHVDEEGTMTVIDNGGYDPSSLCLEKEWQVILSMRTELQGRLAHCSPGQRITIRGRIAHWDATQIQKKLQVIMNYYQSPVFLRENLMYAQVILWQVREAIERLEQFPPTL